MWITYHTRQIYIVGWLKSLHYAAIFDNQLENHLILNINYIINKLGENDGA